jgi:transposase InsO family protein
MSKKPWELVLEKIYKSPGEAGAFSSISKLHHILRKKKYVVSRNDIKKWVQNQYTYSIHRFKQKTFPRNPIVASYIDDNWQADLLFLPELRNYNDRKYIILVCIDVISRHAWGECLRSKHGKSVVNAFKKIVEKSGRKPNKLQTDEGTEFHNKDFKKFLSEHKIRLYSTFSDKKAAIAERCIKEIKKLIYRFLSDNQSNRYIDNIEDIFKTYNTTYHSAIGMSPSEVSEKNLSTVFQNLYGKYWTRDAIHSKQNKLKIGDIVRIAIPSNVFTKGYKGKWTTELFTIHHIQRYSPFYKYQLMNSDGDLVKGLFYEKELQLAAVGSRRFTHAIILKEKLINKKKWVLVTWKNENPGMKRWLPLDQLR